MRSIALAFSIAAACLATTISGLGLRSGFDVDQAVGLTLLSSERSSTTSADADPVASPSPPLPPHLRAAEEEIDGLEAVASGGGSGGISSNATANATAVQGRIGPRGTACACACVCACVCVYVCVHVGVHVYGLQGCTCTRGAAGVQRPSRRCRNA